MLVEIEKVIVNDRIRKDFGDIDGLANSIKTKGLINPPVVTPEFELIAGERRYKALKQLGYNQIEVRVMSVEDEEHMLNLEIDENEERKEFSKLERLDWARRLERIESIKAEKRMIGGGVENFPQGSTGKTRDIVAEKFGIGSGRQYEKEKYIEDNIHLATEEEKIAWDKGDISDHSMFKKIKAEKDAIENKAKQLEEENSRLQLSLNAEKNKPAKVVDNTDYSTINRLKSDMENKNRQMDILMKEKNLLDRKLKLNEQEVKEYGDLKKNIEMLKSQQSDIHRKIESATSISGLVVDIENVLQTKLAPVKYSRAISEQLDNNIVIGNVEEIIARVEDWCLEMRKLLNKDDIITVEVM